MLGLLFPLGVDVPVEDGVGISVAFEADVSTRDEAMIERIEAAYCSFSQSISKNQVQYRCDTGSSRQVINLRESPDRRSSMHAAARYRARARAIEEEASSRMDTLELSYTFDSSPTLGTLEICRTPRALASPFSGMRREQGAIVHVNMWTGEREKVMTEFVRQSELQT